MSDFLSIIVPTFVTLVTAYFSYKLSFSKTSKDAQNEFQDNLMSQTDKLSLRLDAQNERLEKQQNLIVDLQMKNNVLMLEKYQLEIQVKGLQTQIDQISKKI